MTTMDRPVAVLDEQKAGAFADKMTAILDHASLALLTSIGHRAGLFDALAGAGSVTSEQLARAAALEERYVREWLGGMVVGGIVEYDAEDARYYLPPEHAALTTTAAGPDNLAFFCQYFALMGEVEPEIVRVFREGGGVPYSSYPTFQQLQRDETARVYDASLVDGILVLVPGLVARLEEGIEVVDVGTGAGHAVNVMARAFPRSRFLGVDISEEGIALGRSEAADWSLTNARFEVADAAPLTGSYDLVTAFDTVHDQAHPTQLLSSISAALAPEGTFLMGDIAFSSRLEENVGDPLAPLVFAISVFHCLTVSLAYGGEGLGTAWGEGRAREMLAAAGFDEVRTAQVEGDPLNIYYIARRTAR
ncbi:MAG TPA: class I SAM-dependent methyltransferase [Nocardioidaceae bacterium]|nr:class I SAM-dependent methyltransferase [Nocardioidaceae bacterium]